MRYRVRGLEIRSENAAKPCSRAAAWLVKWIAKLPLQTAVLDYGCGKLRYTKVLARQVARVVAVDSEVQLMRLQKIGGRLTTVKDYVCDHLPNVRVVSVESGEWIYPPREFALCSNVISAIPIQAERDRVLDGLTRALRANGFLLLSTQFRNSYFDICRKNPAARIHLDGWLIDGKRGASFYGILPPERLRNLVKRAGLIPIQLGIIGETAFVLARKPARRPVRAVPYVRSPRPFVR